MKIKIIFKTITVFFAVFYLLSLSIYSCLLLGTLAHELMHKQTALEAKAIYVNYDNSGMTYAKNFSYDGITHEWIYFNGFIIEAFLIFGVIISFVTVLYASHKNIL